MKKNFIWIAVILIVVVSIGAFVLLKPDSTTQNDTTVNTGTQEMIPSNDQQPATTTASRYVPLDTFVADQQSNDDKKVVYFFHASWCSICQAIDKELQANPDDVPTDVVIVKTDFDSETDLRKKYGVTTQYTFVQVDAQGNEVAQWSATKLSAVLAGIR